MLLNRTNNPTGKNSCYVGIEVRISREDFITWFMANDFAGCSVDREDPSRHYEVGNLKLIPKGLNAGKDKVKSADGKCECRVCKKTKDLNEFVKDSRRQLTGFSTIYLECESARGVERFKRSQCSLV